MLPSHSTVQIKPGRRVTRHKARLPPNFGPLSLVTGSATACDTPQDPLFGRYTAKLGNFSPPAAAMSQAAGPPAAPPDRIHRVTARTPRRPGLIYTVVACREDETLVLPQLVGLRSYLVLSTRP